VILKVSLSQKSDLAHLVVFQLNHSRRLCRIRRGDHLILIFSEAMLFNASRHSFLLRCPSQRDCLQPNHFWFSRGGKKAMICTLIAMYFRAIKVFVRIFTQVKSLCP